MNAKTNSTRSLLLPIAALALLLASACTPSESDPPPVQPSGSALSSALAEGTPFGFRKGTHLEDLNAQPSPFADRTYITIEAPKPDERFDVYRLKLDRVNQLCEVAGTQNVKGDEAVQQFFRELRDELAALLGSEDEINDQPDQPIREFGLTELKSSWWHSDGTPSWPNPGIARAGVVVMSLGNEGTLVEMIFDLGCE